MELIFFIFLILAILVCSAIVSSSEAALLSISYARIKEISSSELPLRAKENLLLIIKENMQKYITTIVVLNNVINIVGSIFVGVYATEIFGEIYLGVVSGVLTFLIILFSEIIPKIYGERHSEGISLFIAKPLYYLTLLLTPIIYLLHKLSSFFIRGDPEKQVSEGEIRELAAMGKQEGSINNYESEIIENVFKMDDIEAYDIMVPKSDVSVINIKSSFDHILEEIDKTGFTRFPVEKNGEIIGLLNVKDLFKYYGKEKLFRLSDEIRPIFYAPETMKLSTLEKHLKSAKTHMAILVNEHGDFVGIVTLEDIIEEIVGEIEDEFDEEEQEKITKVGEDKFLIDASVELVEIDKELNLNLNGKTGDYSTLNGYLISELGRIPKVNFRLRIDEGTFRILRRNKKKVLEVEFVRK